MDKKRKSNPSTPTSERGGENERKNMRRTKTEELVATPKEPDGQDKPPQDVPGKEEDHSEANAKVRMGLTKRTKKPPKSLENFICRPPIRVSQKSGSAGGDGARAKGKKPNQPHQPSQKKGSSNSRATKTGSSMTSTDPSPSTESPSALTASKQESAASESPNTTAATKTLPKQTRQKTDLKQELAPEDPPNTARPPSPSKLSTQKISTPAKQTSPNLPAPSSPASLQQDSSPQEGVRLLNENMVQQAQAFPNSCQDETQERPSKRNPVSPKQASSLPKKDSEQTEIDSGTFWNLDKKDGEGHVEDSEGSSDPRTVTGETNTNQNDAMQKASPCANYPAEGLPSVQVDISPSQSNPAENKPDFTETRRASRGPDENEDLNRTLEVTMKSSKAIPILEHQKDPGIKGSPDSQPGKRIKHSANQEQMKSHSGDSVLNPLGLPSPSKPSTNVSPSHIKKDKALKKQKPRHRHCSKTAKRSSDGNHGPASCLTEPQGSSDNDAAPEAPSSLRCEQKTVGQLSKSKSKNVSDASSPKKTPVRKRGRPKVNKSEEPLQRNNPEPSYTPGPDPETRSTPVRKRGRPKRSFSVETQPTKKHDSGDQHVTSEDKVKDSQQKCSRSNRVIMKTIIRKINKMKVKRRDQLLTQILLGQKQRCSTEFSQEGSGAELCNPASPATHSLSSLVTSFGGKLGPQINVSKRGTIYMGKRRGRKPKCERDSKLIFPLNSQQMSADTSRFNSDSSTMCQSLESQTPSGLKKNATASPGRNSQLNLNQLNAQRGRVTSFMQLSELQNSRAHCEAAFNIGVGVNDNSMVDRTDRETNGSITAGLLTTSLGFGLYRGYPSAAPLYPSSYPASYVHHYSKNPIISPSKFHKKKAKIPKTKDAGGLWGGKSHGTYPRTTPHFSCDCFSRQSCQREKQREKSREGRDGHGRGGEREQEWLLWQNKFSNKTENSRDHPPSFPVFSNMHNKDRTVPSNLRQTGEARWSEHQPPWQCARGFQPKLGKRSLNQELYTNDHDRRSVRGRTLKDGEGRKEWGGGAEQSMTTPSHRGIQGKGSGATSASATLMERDGTSMPDFSSFGDKRAGYVQAGSLHFSGKHQCSNSPSAREHSENPQRDPRGHRARRRPLIQDEGDQACNQTPAQFMQEHAQLLPRNTAPARAKLAQCFRSFRTTSPGGREITAGPQGKKRGPGRPRKNPPPSPSQTVKLSWSDSEWQRVIFSDESRFSLGGDAQRIRVCGGTVVSTKMDGFVVTRPEDLVSLLLHPYRTICRNCVRMFKLHGMDYHRTPLGTSTAPYRDVWRVGLANTAARRHTERQTSGSPPSSPSAPQPPPSLCDEKETSGKGGSSKRQDDPVLEAIEAVVHAEQRKRGRKRRTAEREKDESQSNQEEDTTEPPSDFPTSYTPSSPSPDQAVEVDEDADADSQSEKMSASPPRKKYLWAGLYSDVYKTEDVREPEQLSSECLDYDPEEHEHGLLPAPLHVGKYLRLKRIDFQLPYDVHWLCAHDKLFGKPDSPSSAAACSSSCRAPDEIPRDSDDESHHTRSIDESSQADVSELQEEDEEDQQEDQLEGSRDEENFPSPLSSEERTFVMSHGVFLVRNYEKMRARQALLLLREELREREKEEKGSGQSDDGGNGEEMTVQPDRCLNEQRKEEGPDEEELSGSQSRNLAGTLQRIWDSIVGCKGASQMRIIWSNSYGSSAEPVLQKEKSDSALLDLSVVQKQLRSGHYDSLEAFHTDMLKVFHCAEETQLLCIY
ncbi:hypothetical protein NFI96_023755 [Prochilodus magdalenae]|nr:hypothetical protein NFI96_023755 [Prochilodus magdalenae]